MTAAGVSVGGWSGVPDGTGDDSPTVVAVGVCHGACRVPILTAVAAVEASVDMLASLVDADTPGTWAW